MRICDNDNVGIDRKAGGGIGGTARFMGAGGAMGALGADFGTLSTNPAGLAMFRLNMATSSRL